jgi:phage-related protein
MAAGKPSFFEAGGRLLVVTTIFQKKTQALPKSVIKRASERMNRWRKERT